MLNSEAHNGKILVVEDETEIANLLELVLTRRGFAVSLAKEAHSALSLIAKSKFDLIVLDWMMPGFSGLEFIQHLRAQENRVPVIFLTAKAQPQDIVSGLEAGADDYLTKPFDNSVLLARISSVLRRSQVSPKEKDPHRLKYRSLAMDLDAHKALMDGIDLELTRSEFRILAELILNSGKVLTRDQLVEKTQGEGVSVTGRTIDTHVFGLRKKLKNNGQWIETIRGVGYRLSES